MEELKSRKNQHIVTLKKLGADRAFRRETGMFLCDGEKLLREALEHGVEVSTVLTARDELSYVPGNVKVFKADSKLIQYVSPMKNPQDIVFSCRIRKTNTLLRTGRHVILEGVQDPGNVGTVIRTANAFGYDSVILAGGCADMYNPKTIRATMGAVFRQNVLEMKLDDICILRDSGIYIYGAALASDSRDLRSVRAREKDGFAVAIGSEGQGLSENMLNICSEKIIIPMAPGCESLNASAAAAVIMWELGMCSSGV